ncbi:hypothetical protein ACTL6U_05865 [Rhodovibrionaceae bacterium A322]
MKSSAESFGDFADSVWNYLNGSFTSDVQKEIKYLYKHVYSSYNPGQLPAKTALTSEALITAMGQLIDNSGKHVVRVQSDSWRVMDKTNLKQSYKARLDYYQNNRQGKRPKIKGQADKARSSYLHIYPDGSTLDGHHIVPPQNRAKENNWRLGINVKPADIPQAVKDLCPIVDQYSDIDHFKVSAPGTAGKPDSVIIYMKNASDTYEIIKGAVWDKFKSYDLQKTFSPIWNEIEEGFAEASEPPKGGSSFGTYRCLLAYLCYWWLYREEKTKPTKDDFLLWLSAVLVSFGIDPDFPHLQEKLTEPPFGKEENKVFFQLMALYKGKSPDFAGAYLMDRV